MNRRISSGIIDLGKERRASLLRERMQMEMDAKLEEHIQEPQESSRFVRLLVRTLDDANSSRRSLHKSIIVLSSLLCAS